MLLALHARYWIDLLAGMPALRGAAEAVLYLVPLLGALVLLGLASRDWRAATADPATTDAALAAT